MLGDYSESYVRVFGAAFGAGVEAAQRLSDTEIERLATYSGIVGLVAQEVKATRAQRRQQAG